MEKPFKVAFVVRQKNGALYQAIKKRGWTFVEAGKFLGINSSSLSSIINLRVRPPEFKRLPKSRKKFREGIMELTGMTFEDLFPEEVYDDDVMERAKSVDFFVERDLATLKLEGSSENKLFVLPEYFLSTVNYEDAIESIKKSLTPRLWQVLELRFLKGMTIAEVAKLLRSSKQVISLTEARALRRIREHPHILNSLRGDEDTELFQALGKDRYESLSRRSVHGFKKGAKTEAIPV